MKGFSLRNKMVHILVFKIEESDTFLPLSYTFTRTVILYWCCNVTSLTNSKHFPASVVLRWWSIHLGRWRQMTWNLVCNQPVIIHWKYVNCIMHCPVNERAQRNVMNKDITLMAFLNSIWVRFLYTTKWPDVCWSFESNLVISCEKVITELLTRW